MDACYLDGDVDNIFSAKFRQLRILRPCNIIEVDS